MSAWCGNAAKGEDGKKKDSSLGKVTYRFFGETYLRIRKKRRRKAGGKNKRICKQTKLELGGEHLTCER